MEDENKVCGGHDPIEIANVINLMPNKYGLILGMNMFTRKNISGTTFGIEELDRDYKRSLIPTAPYCCDYDLPSQQMPGRTWRYFDVPHMGAGDSLRACDLAGVRARGVLGFEHRFQNEQEELLRRTTMMRERLELTMEWRQLTALKGVVMDADGETPLLDMWQFFGLQQHTFYMDLLSTDFDLDAWIRMVKRVYTRQLARNLGWSGITFILDSAMFEMLVKHPSVVDYYKECCDLQERQRAQINALNAGNHAGGIFSRNGVTFIEYYNEGCIADPDPNAPMGATKDIQFLEDNVGHGFLTGVTGQALYELVVAPNMKFGQINRPATDEALFNFELKLNDENDCYHFKLSSNHLPIVKQPLTLTKLVISSQPDPCMI